MALSAFFRSAVPALVAASFLSGLSGEAVAQDNVIPKRRTAIIQNTDFPGFDLQPVFDTDFGSCQRICLADSNCRAFTFNFNANACFPKSEAGERQPFEGAASATVFETDLVILALEKERVQHLSFVPSFFMNEAKEQAEGLARAYITNQWTADQLVEASNNARASGNFDNAMRFMGAALNITDAADGWAEMAALALKVKPGESNNKRQLQRISTSAAINSYLRGTNPGVQVTALNTLAKGLELRGQGRATISALRLAQSISPRFETEDALARAISLYGFRVTEHKVDNNSAAPRICAIFSEGLVKAGVDYADFVRLPESGLVVEASGTQLCIDGVKHGQRYRLTLRAGLPADSGEVLSKSVDLNVYVRDRDPSARFVGRAYVLPRGEAANIPIVTVNLTEVDLKIHRVGDRNLLRSIQNGIFARPLSVWDEEDLQNVIGQEVWSGAGIVEMDVNREVTTALPVGQAISRFEPGVYVMRARVPGADVYDSQAAAQWFIVTDLGLVTTSGGDGLHVFVRSLNSAESKAGAVVQLLATNNTVLGEAVTDAAGYAQFAVGLTRGTGGSAPALLTVADSDDFAFLNLKEAEFDLSDRGVEGRVSPPPIDVYLTTDRGAYRVGETVFATALARDHKAEALGSLPLTAIVTRPDGVEFTRELLDDQGAGGRVFAVHLPNGAQRGTWNIRVHADVDAAALSRKSFLVEDFTPDRIEFDLALQDGPVRVTDVPIMNVNARYLYGAPGAGLDIEGEVRVTLADGYEAYPGYKFGQHDALFGIQYAFLAQGVVTDQDGKARFPMNLPEVQETSRPLQMLALIRMSEGSGRPVERTIRKTLAPGSATIGIKPLFDGVVDEGGLARFEALAVGPDLEQLHMQKVQWTLNRVRTRYQWYEVYGNWNYEPVTTRERVANGEVTLGVDGAVQIEAPVDWGRYELKLENLDGKYTAASQVFYAGWYAPADSGNTPDTLEIGLDKPTYQIGDVAQLRLVPRYGGKALVQVVSNRLIAMKTVDVVEGENLIELNVTEDWGAGAYVTASVIRPMNVAAGRNPARSLGLNWAFVDPGKHRLSVEFLTPDEVAPRGPMLAELQVDGVTEGESVYATIAAVDVGILNLTRFKAPDPDGHYFGQRKLGVAMRDVYGRLIDGTQGALGQIRSGGDGPLAERLQSPPPTEDLVSFFAGPVVADASGRVVAKFDMPEFNGTVRLMAVVWSETGVGQASKDVLVRDPVVMTASLPRFLAPFDESRMLLELAHTKGPAGKVKLDVSATGGLFLDTKSLPRSVNLAAGDRVSLQLPITAPASGTPEITVVLTTPDGQVLTKSLQLPVRLNDPEVARTTRLELADGEVFTFDDNVFAGLLPGSGHATLSVGPIARFDAPGLLSALDRYPYGCTEQITSKALPLLYFDQVATTMGLGGRHSVQERVEQAIAEVLTNQSSSGSFGLWHPDSGDLWLDSYVADFLSRAQERGYAVPKQAFRLAIDNLRNRINYAGDFENAGEDIAYALMVLAREGAANIGDLRYYADTLGDQFATPLAMAQLGAALASYGDQARADAMFRKAGARLDRNANRQESNLWRVDYGTDLRDAAAVLTLAVEAGTEVIDQRELARLITPGQTVNRARSTQENMWSLLAANALIEDTPADAFTVNGTPAGGPLVRVLDAQTGAGQALEIRNQSGKAATTILTTYGVPTEPEPAGGNGYFIDRLYFTMDGAPVSPENIQLNDRLVVVLKITPHGRSEARLMINDPLPAGLEIDNPNLLKSGDVAALDWLQLGTETEFTEFRSERFLAAVDWFDTKPFQLAYVVRAISPGRFHHPAASVEDMYRPEYRARTAAGQVEIAQ